MPTAASTITIDCPSEVLLELHVSKEELAALLKETVAMELFRKGRLSSGLAARWVGQERMPFLMKAMEQGAALLDQGEIDFRRETSLL
jgi:predicted HTH domain antitoxin